MPERTDGLLRRPVQFEQASFRDRTARVVRMQREVGRLLTAEALQNWHYVSQLPFFLNAVLDGRIVNTSLPSDAWQDFDLAVPGADPQWQGCLIHERLPLISYPYEWSFSMLRDAALLQLSLLLEALAEGAILKDATPFNIQFRGSRPVFIDIPSFVRFSDGQPWEGYRQFCQMFLYPLLLQAYRQVDFHPWLRGRLDGISPMQMNGLLSWRDSLRPGVLTHVRMHAWLQQKQNRMSARTAPGDLPAALKSAGFEKSMIVHNVRRLQRIVQQLHWKCTTSLWSDYDQSPSPASTDGSAKEQFVQQVLSSRRWSCVWDLGCNRGRYSRLAAESADLVVALDSDHLTVEQLYHDLRAENNTRIVPLVFNPADPSPAQGWREQERTSLIDRSQPQLILCLAVIHHLVFRELLLLPEVIGWLADRNCDLVIEFIDRDDPQVRSLLADRHDQFTDYCGETFQQHLDRCFIVKRQITLPSGTRRLIHAVPRNPTVVP